MAETVENGAKLRIVAAPTRAFDRYEFSLVADDEGYEVKARCKKCPPFEPAFDATGQLSGWVRPWVYMFQRFGHGHERIECPQLVDFLKAHEDHFHPDDYPFRGEPFFIIVCAVRDHLAGGDAR